MSPKGKKSPAQLVKGMKDILPDEQGYWQFVRGKVENFANSYGFGRIDTPILEFTSLFKRATGETSDIVSKEMYSFETSGGDKLSLRPEGTSGVVRAYIEHGMLNLPQPVKLFYVGPMFRHENPQAGRYRQHWQAGFEVIGEADALVDAQLIGISYFLMKDLGLEVEIQLNSVGDDACRPNYIKALKQYYNSHKKDLCKDCNIRIGKNPLRLLDCKNPTCVELGEGAPQMVDHLCEPCKNHFMMVLEYLDETEVKYNLNHKIVRGLDYYTRTVWEVVCLGEGGKINSLFGGGRYDNLVGLLGGRDNTPAVGFGMGMERVILSMQDAKIEVPRHNTCDIYVAQLGLEPRKKAMQLFEELRKAGFSLAESMSKKGLKDQMEQANKKGAKYTVILGQKEISDGTVLIRDMESGVQEIVDYRKVDIELRKRLENNHLKNKKLKI